MIFRHLVDGKTISNHIFGLEETVGNDNRGRRYVDELRAAAFALVIDKKLPVSRAQGHVGLACETLRGWIEAFGRQQE
jgi:hypothetical protein